MSTAVMVEPTADTSPRSTARIAGVFYLLTFLTGGVALAARGGLGVAAGLIAGASYIAVTLLFYKLFKVVSRPLSLLAAAISLAGCAIGPLTLAHLVPFKINPLVFFGFYCLLIGYLILKSAFLPRALGVLMAVAGLGWLTFLWPSLAASLSPWVMAPGLLGEGSLTLWLLMMGVNVDGWKGHSLAEGYRAVGDKPRAIVNDQLSTRSKRK